MTLKSQLKPRKNQAKASASVRLFRASGRPLEPNHVLMYQADFANVYDKIMLRFGQTDTSIWPPDVAARAQKLLERCDRIIRARYPHIVEVRYPTYGQLVRMVKRYNAECTFSLEPSSGRLCIIVMDEA